MGIIQNCNFRLIPGFLVHNHLCWPSLGSKETRVDSSGFPEKVELDFCLCITPLRGPLAQIYLGTPRHRCDKVFAAPSLECPWQQLLWPFSELADGGRLSIVVGHFCFGPSSAAGAWDNDDNNNSSNNNESDNNNNVFFSVPFLLRSTRPITWNKISGEKNKNKKTFTLCDRPLVLSLPLPFSLPHSPPPTHTISMTAEKDQF